MQFSEKTLGSICSTTKNKRKKERLQQRKHKGMSTEGHSEKVVRGEGLGKRIKMCYARYHLPMVSLILSNCKQGLINIFLKLVIYKPRKGHQRN